MTDGQAHAFELELLRLFPGACFGLMRKTALVRLTYPPDIGPLALEQLEQALSRTAESAEPVPEHIALGQQVRDLLLLVLERSREPIFEARLLGGEAGRLLLAVGWDSEATLRQAIALVPRLINTGLHSPAGELRKELSGALPFGAPSTSLLVSRLTAAAYRMGHPIEPQGDFVRIGWGARAKRLAHAMTQSTSAIAVRTARWKFLANRLLADAGVPVPECAIVATLEGARDAARRLDWPVVVKPSDMDGGIGVSTNIDSEEALACAFEAARTKGAGSVLVERHVDGHDHRLLVVRDRVLIATRRTPGGVVGDGTRSIAELVSVANADPRRGTDKQTDLLLRLDLDDEALACLAQQRLTPDSVVERGSFVQLRHGANISQGGTAEDITNRIHPDNRTLAIRAARIVGLDIAGVDLLCPDIERSWRMVGGAICEVNAQPMLRVHWLASPERNIEAEIIDCITDRATTRIPVTAVTGRGETAATALTLHRMMTQAGLKTGTCTARGVRIDGDIVFDGDAASFQGARMILADPLVENAILALSPSHIAQFGHPCDRYDVAAVIPPRDAEDGDPDRRRTLDRLTRDIVDRTRSTLVLDADDALHSDLRRKGDRRRHILVADRGDGNVIQTHRESGGAAVFLANHDGQRAIVLAVGQQVSKITALQQLKNLNALNRASLDALLFGTALSFARGFNPGTLGRLLSSGFEQPRPSHPCPDSAP